jgi:hypothetical protein
MATHPTVEQLTQRLTQRFVGPSTAHLDDVQGLVRASAESAWTTPADAKARKAELQEALRQMEGSHDALLAYLRPVVDLQLTKAAALRTYCALLAAVCVPIALSAALPGVARGVAWFVIVLALFGAGMTLQTSRTHWPTDEQFGSAEAESRWLIGLLHQRGHRVNDGVTLTQLATGLLAVPLIGVAMALWPAAQRDTLRAPTAEEQAASGVSRAASTAQAAASAAASAASTAGAAAVAAQTAAAAAQQAASAAARSPGAQGRNKNKSKNKGRALSKAKAAPH